MLIYTIIYILGYIASLYLIHKVNTTTDYGKATPMPLALALMLSLFSAIAVVAILIVILLKGSLFGTLNRKFTGD